MSKMSDAALATLYLKNKIVDKLHGGISVLHLLFEYYESCG